MFVFDCINKNLITLPFFHFFLLEGNRHFWILTFKPKNPKHLSLQSNKSDFYQASYSKLSKMNEYQVTKFWKKWKSLKLFRKLLIWAWIQLPLIQLGCPLLLGINLFRSAVALMLPNRTTKISKSSWAERQKRPFERERCRGSMNRKTTLKFWSKIQSKFFFF